MNAGMELNAEVSEKIMGVPACRRAHPHKGYDPYTGRCLDCGRMAALEYSQGMWAAWLIVEKLDPVLHLELKRYAVGWQAVFSTYDLRRVQESAETPAEAICLAALAAVAQNPGLEIPKSENC